MFRTLGVRRRGYRMANVFAWAGPVTRERHRRSSGSETFFTFFFIPLIPLGSKYRSTCTRCGAVGSLTREQADAAVANARQAHEQAQAGGPPPSRRRQSGRPRRRHLRFQRRHRRPTPTWGRTPSPIREAEGPDQARSTASTCHSSGRPLRLCRPRSSKTMPEPTTRSRTVPGDQHLTRPRHGAHP